MGRLFCILGKSGAGKDSVYKRLLEDQTLALQKVVPYTTRPIRAGEQDGIQYHFVSEETRQQMERAGKIIEQRSYKTWHGIWTYFTAEDGQIDLQRHNYLLIGTLESFLALKSHYATGRVGDRLDDRRADQNAPACAEDAWGYRNSAVVPIYIEVEDGLRLDRALRRERGQKTPRYEEMCRRFLADVQDFSEEKLAEAGIGMRFENISLEACAEKIRGYIEEFFHE